MSGETASPTRLASLDGLRGWAAVVVVTHHTLLTFPEVADAHAGERPEGVLLTTLVSTPLHLLWAGPEAVLVFFVLSGFVLAAATNHVGFSWRQYYPSRMLRLYLPVAAALALAVAAHELTDWANVAEGSWLTARDQALTMGRVARDLTLAFGHSGVLSPLWSLRWEIWFSLLLPAYLLLTKGRVHTWPIAVMALVSSGLGWCLAEPALAYLPVFLLGCIIWRCRGTIMHGPDFTASMTAVLATATTLLLTSSWIVNAQRLDSPTVGGFCFMLSIGGAALAVVLAQRSPLFRRRLSSRLSQWLGTVSFSVYLVHEPVIVLMARYLGPSPSTALLSAGLALWAGHLFFVVVERRSHRFAKHVGGRLAGARVARCA